MVPLLPSRIISYGKRAIVVLIPDPINKRYDIVVQSGVSQEDMESAINGTVHSDGRGKDPYLIHSNRWN